jgi:hypothetical protein
LTKSKTLEIKKERRPEGDYACNVQTHYFIRTGHEPPEVWEGFDAKTYRLIHC